MKTQGVFGDYGDPSPDKTTKQTRLQLLVCFVAVMLHQASPVSPVIHTKEEQVRSTNALWSCEYRRRQAQNNTHTLTLQPIIDTELSQKQLAGCNGGIFREALTRYKNVKAIDTNSNDRPKPFYFLSKKDNNWMPFIMSLNCPKTLSITSILSFLNNQLYPTHYRLSG